MESLKTLSIKEAERKVAQVPDEVVLEAVKALPEEKQHKAKLAKRIQSAMEQSAKIFSTYTAEREDNYNKQ